MWYDYDEIWNEKYVIGNIYNIALGQLCMQFIVTKVNAFLIM